MKTYPIGRDLKLLVSRFESAANRELLPLGITAAQAQLLIILDNSTDTLMPQKNLEKAAGASQASVAGIVSRLESKGLVTCKRDGEDRRIQLVAITEKGSELCESAFDALKTAEKKVFKNLTPEEFSLYSSLIKKLGIDEA